MKDDEGTEVSGAEIAKSLHQAEVSTVHSSLFMRTADYAPRPPMYRRVLMPR